MLKYLLKFFIILIFYLASGKLGLLLLAPTKFSALLWPPAGVALGALFIFGNRFSPAIFIGAFILNYRILGYFTIGENFLLLKVFVSVLVAIGYTLQAAAGACLIKRLFGTPIALKKATEIFPLFILAIIPCFVSAALGILNLYLIDLINSNQMLMHYVKWLFSDILGVIVFLPLVFLSPLSFAKIKWRGKDLKSLSYLALTALILSLGLVFYIARIAAQNSYQENLTHFDSLCNENQNALLRRLDSYDYALLGAVGFIRGSEFISRSEWQSYVETLDIYNNFPGIGGVGLITPVAKKNLDNFLKEARKDNAPNFAIHPKNFLNDEFYIIKYIEPEKYNDKAVGLNIAFEESRFEAANLARDSGFSAITNKIILVQDNDKTAGFLLLHPIYSKTFLTNSKERRDSFLGWVYAPFIAKNFLYKLTRSQGEDFDLKVYDGAEESKESLIYSNIDFNHKSKFVVKKQVEVMQKEWLFVCSSTASYENNIHDEEASFIVIGGVLFTLFLGIFFMLSIVRGRDAMELLVTKYQNALLIFILLLTTSIAFYAYKVLQQREMALVTNLVMEESKKIEAVISAKINADILALKRMAQRWEVAKVTPEKEWRIDAANYNHDIAGLNAVQFVDKTYHIRLVEPMKGNEKVLGLDILFDEKRKSYLENAGKNNSITVTPPFKLIQGYNAFIAYAPININKEFAGFITGVFAIDKFLDSVLNDKTKDAHKVILSYNDFVADSENQKELSNRFTITRDILIYDKDWKLTITPTKSYVKSHLTFLPFIILIAGLIIAVLLVLTIRYVLIARIRSKHLAEINSLNEAVLSSSMHMIIATDVNGVVIIFNQAAEKSLGYKAEEIVGKQTPQIWHDIHEIEARAQVLSKELNKEIKPGFEVFVAKANVGIVDSNEWTFIRKDGSRFPVNLTVTTLIGEDGQIAGYLGIIEDITKRKLAEEKSAN